jgi:hypothetical protein
MIVNQGLILGSGDRGAFAVDSSNGTVRWKVSANGKSTNPIYSKEENALIFCDRADFIKVDASTGKVILRVPHALASDPKYFLLLGSHFVVAGGNGNAVVINVSTGELAARFPEPDPELRFSPLEFLLSQPPTDFIEKLMDDKTEPPVDPAKATVTDVAFGQLKALINHKSMLFGKSDLVDTDYWLVNGDTGAVRQFRLAGTQAQVDPSFRLIYLILDDRLRAAELPAN